MPLKICPVCKCAYDWIMPLNDLRPYVAACKRCIDVESKKQYVAKKYVDDEFTGMWRERKDYP